MRCRTVVNVSCCVGNVKVAVLVWSRAKGCVYEGDKQLRLLLGANVDVYGLMTQLLYPNDILATAVAFLGLACIAVAVFSGFVETQVTQLACSGDKQRL